MTGNCSTGEWWRGAVIYQIYPRSFQDTTGDGLGDLPGITARLAHVASLGVDAIWVSPFFPSPMHDMGYDVAGYCDVDPMFGTLGDFDRLLDAAGELGLRTIIDQVLSHSSNAHPYFEASRMSRTDPKADWYVWADAAPDGGPPNNWLSIFGGSAWQWDGRRKQYFLHNFSAGQPDFNFHNPAVREWHLQNMAFWLDRGVDGFRLDAINYAYCDHHLRSNPPLAGADPTAVTNPYDLQDHVYDKSRPETLSFLEEVRSLCDRYGATFLLGEIGDNQRSLEMMAHYSAKGRLHSCYSFDLLGPEISAAHIAAAVGGFVEKVPLSLPAWSFSNHDVPRHVGRWARATADPASMAHMAAAVLLSLPGAVCMYQGEELGLVEPELRYEDLRDPQGLAFWPDPQMQRDGARAPMVWEAGEPNAGFSPSRPWLPVGDAQAALAVDAQVGRADSVLETYRRLIALRKSRPSLRNGPVTFVPSPEPVLVMVRGNDTAVVANLSAEPASAGVEGLGSALESRLATVTGSRLSLGGNGWGIFEVEAEVRAR